MRHIALVQQMARYPVERGAQIEPREVGVEIDIRRALAVNFKLGMPCRPSADAHWIMVVGELVTGDVDDQIVTLQPCMRMAIPHTADVDESLLSVFFEIFRQDQRRVAARPTRKFTKRYGQELEVAFFDCGTKALH